MIPSVDQVAFLVLCDCNCFSCLLCASRSVTAECFSVRVRTRAVSAGKQVYRPADTPRTLQYICSAMLAACPLLLQIVCTRALFLDSETQPPNNRSYNNRLNKRQGANSPVAYIYNQM